MEKHDPLHAEAADLAALLLVRPNHRRGVVTMRMVALRDDVL
jgi:hypothetical protein